MTLLTEVAGKCGTSMESMAVDPEEIVWAGVLFGIACLFAMIPAAIILAVANSFSSKNPGSFWKVYQGVVGGGVFGSALIYLCSEDLKMNLYDFEGPFLMFTLPVLVGGLLGFLTSRSNPERKDLKDIIA